MDSNNFSFMKSGFDNLESKPKIDNRQTSQVLAVMTIYMENAIKIAEKIAVYNNRDILTDKDIILSLKSQALDNYEIWNKDETKRDLMEISQHIYHDLVESQNIEDGDSDTQLSDVDEDNLEDTNKIDPKVETIRGDITPEFLEKLRTVEERWNCWNPLDTEYVILKNAINKTENKFKS